MPCVNFRNMYGFLSQVIPYQDSDLEQLYTYLRFLLTKLPKRDTGPGYHLEEEVELQYYRLQKISKGQIDLNTGDGKPLKGPSDVGTGREQEPRDRSGRRQLFRFVRELCRWSAGLGNGLGEGQIDAGSSSAVVHFPDSLGLRRIL